MPTIGPTELLLISIICIPTVLLASGAVAMFFLLLRRTQSQPVVSSSPAGPVSDPAVRLQKLQELRQAGTISQEEYEQKRAAILADL